jgi:anti-sigma factor RsiW
VKQELVDRLAEYVFGDLSEDEMRQMAKILADSPALAEEAALLREALAHHAAALPPIPPSVAGRERLLATLRGVDRFRPFLGPLCQMLDLPEEEVQRLLAGIDDPAAWDVGPLPGIYLTHFQPGPRLAVADAGFVRVIAGHAIPRHRHLGPEVAFVLEGTLWEDGVPHHPGSRVQRAAGSVHESRAGTERDLVFAVTHNGIEMVCDTASDGVPQMG